MNKQFYVDLYFDKPPCFAWSGMATTTIEARGMARREAISLGYKDEVKRVRAGTTQPESN